jgi:methyl-accepting chemotaxis protein
MSPTPTNATLQDQIETLHNILQTQAMQIAALSEGAEQRNRQITDLVGKMNDLHAALMEVQPGQVQSLLARMATVTVGIESGQRVGRMMVWVAGVMIAIAGILQWSGWHQVAGK